MENPMEKVEDVKGLRERLSELQMSLGLKKIKVAMLCSGYPS